MKDAEHKQQAKMKQNLKTKVMSAFAGLSMLGMSGCGTIPIVVIEEKAPYVENVPDKILLTDLAKRRAYYKDKVVFDADVAVGSNVNYEIFIADKDGSNQRRLTYNEGVDMDPYWTRDGKIIYGTASLTDYIIDPETGEREEATIEAYWDAIKFHKERMNAEK